MKVQYEVSNGELKVCDESGRMIILNEAYWEVRKRSPDILEHNFTRYINSRAPTTEVPDELFHNLYHGIRMYFKKGWKALDAGKGFDTPRVVALRNNLQILEDRIVEILEKEGKEDFSNYNCHRKFLAHREVWPRSRISV